MKKNLLLLFISILVISFVFIEISYAQTDGLIISEVMDGNRSGGIPKYIEITNCHVQPRTINGLKIRMGVNGGALSDKVTISSGSQLASSASYVIAANSTHMTDAGFSAPDQTNGNISGNGNDVYALTTSDDTIIDIFGIVGTTSDWYKDSYAIRNSNINNGSDTYSESDWTITSIPSGQPSGGSPGNPGSHTFDQTLPVTLSTFTAQYLNNIPTLYWVTQSETDNIGWYVYRNTQNDFITSMIISDLIPGCGTTTEPHSYIYEDPDFIGENSFPGDTYWYWLESIDFGGMINHYDKVAHIVIPENYDPGNENPEEFEEFGLFQSNPNPFNPKTEETTEISFNLKEQAYVEINIYNIKGELVKTIYDGFNTADKAVWDGKDANGNQQATGIYLYELKVNNKMYSTKRIILIR
ncbi:MAG: lamin tail domain-containing protein [Candidatus Cloacimonetes bacterium]|nr:lamin tail domain-containing protein [Candidatus Cloacimonadota bacterium]